MTCFLDLGELSPLRMHEVRTSFVAPSYCSHLLHQNNKTDITITTKMIYWFTWHVKKDSNWYSIQGPKQMPRFPGGEGSVQPTGGIWGLWAAKLRVGSNFSEPAFGSQWCFFPTGLTKLLWSFFCFKLEGKGSILPRRSLWAANVDLMSSVLSPTSFQKAFPQPGVAGILAQKGENNNLKIILFNFDCDQCYVTFYEYISLIQW